MIYEIPQSGVGQWNAKGLHYARGLVKIKNIGTTQVNIGTDSVAVARGNAGYPLAPNETWETDFPTEGTLYAMSEKAGGGLIDFETIPAVQNSVLSPSRVLAAGAAPRPGLMQQLSQWFNPVIRCVALLLAFSAVASATDIHVQCQVPRNGPCRVAAAQWGSANQTWIVPAIEGYMLSVYVTNYNPSNTHALNVAIYHTPDDQVADFSSNSGSWVADTASCPVSILPSTTVVCVGSNTIASQIALKVTGASAAAGTPDTFSIFIQMYAASSLNLLSRHNVWTAGNFFGFDCPTCVSPGVYSRSFFFSDGVGGITASLTGQPGKVQMAGQWDQGTFSNVNVASGNVTAAVTNSVLDSTDTATGLTIACPLTADCGFSIDGTLFAAALKGREGVGGALTNAFNFSWDGTCISIWVDTTQFVLHGVGTCP